MAHFNNGDTVLLTRFTWAGEVSSRSLARIQDVGPDGYQDVLLSNGSRIDFTDYNVSVRIAPPNAQDIINKTINQQIDSLASTGRI